MKKLLLLALFTTLNFIHAGSASAHVNLCNTSSYPLALYEAYQKEEQYEQGTMSSRMWLEIPVGGCKTIVRNPRGFRITYFIASINRNGERAFLRDIEFDLQSDSDDIHVQNEHIELIDLEHNFCVRRNSRDALQNAPVNENMGVERCPSGSYLSEIDFAVFHPQGNMAANIIFDGQKMWIERL